MSENSLTIDGGAATRLPVPAGGQGGLSQLMGRFTQFTRQPAVAKSLPLLGLLGVLAVAAVAWMSLREPPQRDLFSGLGDADKGAIADALTQANIPYEVDEKSGTLTVSEGDYHKAKMKLAAEGLPKSAPDGDSMINSLPMGASRAVEGEKLRSAREMDLARTIEAIDAVQSARVHLAVEAPSIFLRDRSKPQASVMLRVADGRSLSDAQVQAIVHLVASSVPEMEADSVSVVDQSGRLLSSPGAGQGAAETDRQIAVQARVEERYRQAVVALLTPIVGAENFSTEVHTELDFSERQATRESFPADQARLRSEQGSWSSDKGAGAEASGIPGALSANAPAAAQTAAPNATGANQPPTGPAAPAVGPDGKPLTAEQAAAAPKTNETFNRNFELGREVAVTRDAIGSVKRVSVAVALRNGKDGKPRTPEEVAALEQLVKGAIGFDQARGDVVALSSRAFVETTEPEANWYEAEWVAPLVRNLSALLVAIVLVLGVGRPLLKRRAAIKQEEQVVQGENNARISQEISQELSRAALADPAQPVTLDMISSTHGYAERAVLIRNFVKQDPDRAALVVRDLLREGDKKKDAA